MIIGIDCGHTLTGEGTGAVGYKDEGKMTREVGNRLMAMLKEKGHTIINCTVDYSKNELADRVSIANKQNLDIFVSLHLNAYKKTTAARGIEVYTYSGGSSAVNIAKRTLNEVIAATGWKNRGHKTADYYVLRNTIAPAFLIELGFCDSKADMDLWNTEKIAKALFKGITNSEYVAPAPSSNKLFRVVCGTYSDRKNAEEQQAKLKKAGFDSFLVAIDK